MATSSAFARVSRPTNTNVPGSSAPGDDVDVRRRVRQHGDARAIEAPVARDRRKIRTRDDDAPAAGEAPANAPASAPRSRTGPAPGTPRVCRRRARSGARARRPGRRPASPRAAFATPRMRSSRQRTSRSRRRRSAVRARCAATDVQGARTGPESGDRGRRRPPRTAVTAGSPSPIVTTTTSCPRSTRNRENSGPCVAGPPTSGGQMPVRKTMRMSRRGGRRGRCRRVTYHRRLAMGHLRQSTIEGGAGSGLRTPPRRDRRLVVKAVDQPGVSVSLRRHFGEDRSRRPAAGCARRRDRRCALTRTRALSPQRRRADRRGARVRRAHRCDRARKRQHCLRRGRQARHARRARSSAASS